MPVRKINGIDLLPFLTACISSPFRDKARRGYCTVSAPASQAFLQALEKEQ
jgi:hypothetical protein